MLHRRSQQGFDYVLTSPFKQTSTSNQWKHVKKKHPDVAHELLTMAGGGSSKRPASLTLPAADQFFMPRSDHKRPRLQTNRFCELLLRFIVNNDFHMSLIESPSFRELIFNISPETAICSRRTLGRDLAQKFKYHREILARDDNGFTAKQLWTFQRASGDVLCMAQVINLAVQGALKTLKADPATDPNHYRAEEECGRIPTVISPHADAVNPSKSYNDTYTPTAISANGETR